MRKTGMILIFIFLTGLFSGLFFSTNLSPEGNDSLSSILLAGFSREGTGFSKTFIMALLANLVLFLLMLPAVFSKYLKPLPLLILWYKSFALGFCSGLVYLNAASEALGITLLRLFPQNLFYIPAFIIFAAAVLRYSGDPDSAGRHQADRHAPLTGKRVSHAGSHINSRNTNSGSSNYRSSSFRNSTSGRARGGAGVHSAAGKSGPLQPGAQYAGACCSGAYLSNSGRRPRRHGGRPGMRNNKKNRPMININGLPYIFKFNSNPGPLYVFAAALMLLILGAFTESVFHSIAL